MSHKNHVYMTDGTPLCKQINWITLTTKIKDVNCLNCLRKLQESD